MFSLGRLSFRYFLQALFPNVFILAVRGCFPFIKIRYNQSRKDTRYKGVTVSSSFTLCSLFLPIHVGSLRYSADKAIFIYLLGTPINNSPVLVSLSLLYFCRIAGARFIKRRTPVVTLRLS